MSTQLPPPLNGALSAAEILESQVIEIKRGRMNQFGFEPAWNAYFDFYLGTKYFTKPLLRLEDVAFHLFLRKNLNDHDPKWHMPSIRQMKQRLGVSQDRLDSMIERLMGARLLEKESGLQQGPKRANVHNVYIISDPIQGLGDLLVVAASGSLAHPLKKEWQTYLQKLQEVELPPVPEIGTGGVPISGTPPVPEIGTHKQTSYKQTSKKQTTRAREDDSNNNSNATNRDKSAVVVALSDLGLAKKVAQQLANKHNREHIFEKIDYLQFLLDDRPDQVKNPRGWLRSAIEEDYGAPDGFVTAEERQHQAEAEQRRQQAEEADRQAALAAAEQAQKARVSEKAEIEQRLAAEWGTDEEDRELWEQVKRYLTNSNFSPMFLPAIRLLKFDDSIVKIGVDNDFMAKQLSHPGTLKQLGRAFKSQLKHEVEIELITIDGFVNRKNQNGDLLAESDEER